MIISITGASGFVGKKLVERCLLEGHLVRILSRRIIDRKNLPNNVEIFNYDLNDPNLPLEFVNNTDVLYHCAAEIKDKEKMVVTNFSGTNNLIQLSKGMIGRWVQLSSVGVYGTQRYGIVTENSPENPSNTYEISKKKADDLVREAQVSGAFDASLLRPTIIYGKDMENKSIYKLIETINKGIFFYIGSKGAQANYVHVEDVVEALFECGISNEAKNRVFNLSAGGTIEELVEVVVNTLRCRSPSLRLPEVLIRSASSILRVIPNFPLSKSRVDALSCRAQYPSNKIRDELNFIPKVSLNLGMAEMAKEWKHQN